MKGFCECCHRPLPSEGEHAIIEARYQKANDERTEAVREWKKFHSLRYPGLLEILTPAAIALSLAHYVLKFSHLNPNGPWQFPAFMGTIFVVFVFLSYFTFFRPLFRKKREMEAKRREFKQKYPAAAELLDFD